MKTLATGALVAALGLCLTSYGASAGGLGGGGGHGGGGFGGGGGHMGGGMGGTHAGGGHGMGAGAGLATGGAMTRSAGAQQGAGRQNFAAGPHENGPEWRQGHRIGGGRVVRGGGYGFGYGVGDPSYVYGDNEQDLETGRSAAETGDVCATPVTACQMPEETYVGQSCACRTSSGRSLGRVTQ